LSSDLLEQLTLLVRQERGALVGIARSEGLGAEDAVECVQDALCTFLSRPITAETEDVARASLRVTTRNAARNARRLHHRARVHVPIEGEEPPSPTSDAESLLSHAEDVVRLRACVAELCSIQRSVVMLRLLDEQSGEDVAATLGITRGHLDVLVHRAKSALRVCMRHGREASDTAGSTK
jgi:RNA polymerase sigma-70 factor (ECF subfamily)